MDPISILGSLFASLCHVWRLISQKFRLLSKKFAQEKDVPMLVAKLLCPQLLPQIEEAAELIKPGFDDELLDFRASYLCDSNVIAIKGVLIAQIGVAGLSLPLIHQTHWLASGFFVVGIVGAILAVYKSTVSRKLIGSLLEPEDIRLWLSAPAAAMTLPTTNRTSTVSNSAQPAPNNSHRTSDRPRPIPPPIITHDSQTSEPSLYAALILSLPSMFLQTSLSSILLALATYLSSIRSRHLSIDGTKVFIFFLISTFALIGIYYISKTLKEMEQQQMTRRKRPSSSDTEHAVVTEDEARTPNTNRRRRMTPVATTQRRRDRGSGSWVRSRSHGRHH